MWLGGGVSRENAPGGSIGLSGFVIREPVSTRTATPTRRSIAAPVGAYIVAALPDIGLVEHDRPTTYRLHTSKR